MKWIQTQAVVKARQNSPFSRTEPLTHLHLTHTSLLLPLRWLYAKATSCPLKTSTEEQCCFINGNSRHCRTRILEVSMVNKDEAWIKQDAESTRNLGRRVEKREGEIIISKLDIRQRKFYYFSSAKLWPLHSRSQMWVSFLTNLSVLWEMKRINIFHELDNIEWRRACLLPAGSITYTHLKPSNYPKNQKTHPKRIGSTKRVQGKAVLYLSRHKSWVYYPSSKFRKNYNSGVQGYYTSEHLVIENIKIIALR